MSIVVGGWIGCSSGTNQGGPQQSCHGSPGDEFCSCNSSGSCNSGLTCAVDLQQCVHLAGATTGAGGSTITGGSTGAGNANGSGGSGAGSGGVQASGGAAGSRSTGTGGGLSTGGTGAVAGSRGNGGSASGGTTGGAGRGGSAGGATGSGNSSGAGGSMTGTGGAQSTSCGTLKPSASGNGEFTHYNFGMGTGKDSSTGMYLTACGYLGSESNSIDTVTNIANTAPAKNTYFAAIPGNSSGNFNTNGSCGACVEIANGGHTIIATIIDECPEDSNPVCKQNPTGELDLSVDAFNALGFPNGNPSGTSWKVVPCPVSGNVAVRIKPGNQNEAFIQNTVLALQSVSGPGGNASRTSYGSWHFNGNLGSGTDLTLTDVANRTLQVTLTSGSMGQNQDTGKQFPTCQ